MSSRGMIEASVIAALAVTESRTRSLRIQLLVVEVLLGLALALLAGLLALA